MDIALTTLISSLLITSTTLPPIETEANNGPIYLTRDLPILAKELGLSDNEDALSILRLLLIDYDTQFNALSQSVQNRSQDAYQSLSGNALGSELRDIQASFRLTHDDIAREIALNIEAVLDEEHRPKWDGARRMLTRQRLLPRGQFSAERIDIQLIFNETFGDSSYSNPEVVQQILDEWAIAIDAALVARIPWDRVGVNEILHLVTTGQSDRAADLLESQYVHNRAVRSNNLETAEAIADALTTDASIRWTDAVLSKAFPSIYRRDGIDALFDYLQIELTTPETSEEQLSLIADLRSLYEQYDLERQPIRATLRTLQLQTEGLETIHKLRGQPNMQNDAQTQRFKALESREQLFNHYEEAFAELVGLERYLIAREAIHAQEPDIRMRPIPRALLGEGPRGELPTVPSQHGPGSGMNTDTIIPKPDMPSDDADDQGPRQDMPVDKSNTQGPRT